MDFDQNIFSYFYNLRKRRKENVILKTKQDRGGVDLETVRDSLNVFASAIFQKTLEIKPSDDFPYVSGKKLFLPKYIATEMGEDRNYLFYKVLILHLYAVKNTLAEVEGATSLFDDLTLISQKEDECYDFLCKRFPNYERMYAELTKEWLPQDYFIAASDRKLFTTTLTGMERRILWGKLPRKTSILEADDTTPVTREALPDGGTEKQNKKSQKINKVNFDEDKENIGQDVFHHFEKVETVEEYKGIQRELDGSDDLEAHANALDDLNIEEVIRSSKSAQSLYKTDLDLGFEVTDLKNTEEISSTQVFSYDEWDEKKHQYKKDWCKVYHEIRTDLEKKEHHRTKSLLEIIKERQFEITTIKKKLVQLSSEVFVRKKLLDGRMVDIDNYIRNQSYHKAGVTGDGRFYQETIKKHRDMCVLLLVDSSLSSDSWVQNKRVLDISLEALLVFGEASGMLGDPVMVAGFNSNTRNNCKFLEWKSFDQDWNAFKTKVDHIVPEGYTRIGPAIRHATYILNQRKEKHKVLLIFTDGRPTDYDRYEGTYGLSDVRKAIKESESTGVATFAIAVDPSAKQFLPNLFGNGNFQILMNIQKLPEILTRLYVKLSKGK